MTQSKQYWQSLEELEGRTTDRGPEFPAGADLPPDELSRRTMLKMMGASAALVGGAACRRPVEHIVPYVEKPAEITPGVARAFATTVTFGTSAYGVVVESREGRPVKIEGNELHPSSGGAANVWTQAAILDLYDPDRGGDVLHRPADGELGASDLDSLVAAWAEIAAEHEADGGAGLAVLSEQSASPTLMRLSEAFAARFPSSRWVWWEPVHDGNVFQGWGRRRPRYDLSQADVVLALDADLLHTESDGLSNARGFAAARNPERDGDPVRLYVAEPSLSVTGANADHRLVVQSRGIPALAAAIASELGVDAAGFEGAGEVEADIADRVAIVAADLRRAGARGLVAAGRRQPPAVHALCRAINEALGSVGTTVTLGGLGGLGWGTDAELATLAGSMQSGEVRTLVVIGGNPVARAPGDLALAESIGAVERVVHLGSRVDETSALASWFVPAAHQLEAWSDAVAADGTPSVAQPLIAPLLGGVSPIQLASLLVTDGLGDGMTDVRATWAALTPDEASWRRVLHDGVATGLAFGAADEAAGAEVAGIESEDLLPPLPEVDPAGLELVVTASRSVWDGRSANNGWLQELSDPMTRLTWTNVAAMSAATAAALGVESGETVVLRVGEAEARLPALVLPGQADGSVVAEIGYGEASSGRVGGGVGGACGPLRRTGLGWSTGLTVHGTGQVDDLASTQEHWSMEGRHLVREATLSEYREDPAFAQQIDAGLHLENLWPDPDVGRTSPNQWGMAIDLTACIGCGACVVACQSENNIPVVGPAQVSAGREMAWLRIDRYFAGEPDDPEVVFQPVPCMHCDNAPCEQVCPVAATVHDPSGLNVMVYNRCIGTRYCSNNCPYKVRRFNFFNFTKETPEISKMAMNPEVTVRSRGVMEKCTYCVQRLTRAASAAKREDRAVGDGDVATACQQTCPTRAIHFGNIAVEASEVSRAKGSSRNYVMLAELNNRPRTSYLAKVRNPNPEWTA